MITILKCQVRKIMSRARYFSSIVPTENVKTAKSAMIYFIFFFRNFNIFFVVSLVQFVKWENPLFVLNSIAYMFYYHAYCATAINTKTPLKGLSHFINEIYISFYSQLIKIVYVVVLFRYTCISTF